MSGKLVSIVIASYNGEATIGRALESIRPQKTAAIELILIDGKSTDGTVELVRSYSDIIDHWVSEPDAGIYSAWNKGLRAARGDWICFLGADDWYVEDGLASYLDAIRGAPAGTEFLSSCVRFHSVRWRATVLGQAWRWPQFQRRMIVAHVGALHHRRLYDRVGAYDESYRICGDYELLLRPRKSLVAAFLPKITANMSGGGASTTQLARLFDETCRAKHEAGGRPRWRCMLEQHADHARTVSKYLIQGALR